MDISTITENTRLAEILQAFPWLTEELIRIDERFKFLSSPIGKMLMGSATLADMSKHSGMTVDELLKQLKELAAKHTGQ